MSSDVTAKRIPGPDIVRTVAAFFMVSVHYFVECGYYGTALDTPLLFIMTAMRWLFMCSVPLFMMLTGFFKCNKEPDRAHYISLVPIGISYLFFSVIRILLSNYYLGATYGLKEAMQVLGDYSIAWYVGFYISLMAVAPFLNRLWHSLKSKKEQHILLISLICISTLYPIVSLPASSEATPVAVIGSLFGFASPGYWQMLYPLLYYFLGCYFRENKPKINKLILLAAVAITVLVNAAISFSYADGSNFNWHILGKVDSGYNCITLSLCSASLFLLLYDTEVKGKIVRNILGKISSVSLEIYLSSAIFEMIIFDRVNRMFFTIEDHARLFFPLVLLNFTASALVSLIYKKIYGLIAQKLIKHQK